MLRRILPVCLPATALIVVLAACGETPTTSSVLASPANEIAAGPYGKSGFNCGGGWSNPCNGEGVVFDGACKNSYHMNVTDSGEHHVLHFKWAGNGTGNQGNEYNLSLVGNAQAESGVDVGGGTLLFEVPYRATIAGSGQTFFATGMIDAYVNGGKIVGLWITSLESECALDTPAP